ncbi:hypothetical protein NQ318_016242 [Aromia moschata]|uniref:S1 motif domain-containing protein n=1 Tax=Aromia moschata TaxID=1265417 RepID=A0AAV8Y1J1_9CUCU|nr:hypothetical protein NQ318_016242 [Aromia moschata]
MKAINKLGSLNPKLEKTIKSVRSMEELEIIYAPFKPGGKRTLAERAKELGLQEPAMYVLNNVEVDLNSYILPEKKELSKIEDVEKGIIHIIAYTIATDTEMLSYLRQLRTEINFIIETKKSHSKQDSKSKLSVKKEVKGKLVDESKFENYFDYKIPVKYIKPHQILAINRGEHNKILSVKVVVPDFFFNTFFQFCTNKWTKNGKFDSDRKRIIEEAIKDSYNRLVQPLIVREIRAELRTKAEKASVDVFSTNLKQLLLTAPIKGQPILAIDPGYSNGCKLALVSQTGSLLASNVIYLHKSKGKSDFGNAEVLKNMLEEHDCTLIALGNGTACRETEEWLTHLIQQKIFSSRDVHYCIGCLKNQVHSEKFQLLKMSLARRVQDPLAELVKVEPQHLGVGIRIAGLSEKRATQIINYREENGPFLYRKQLTDVSGIGVKIFEQCAGFLRVGPTDAREASEDLGELNFINTVKSSHLSITDLSEELGSTEETMKLILEALSKPLNYDLRTEFSQAPLFKKGLISIYDISVGTVLTGRIKNVTHFGCFVDIGVGTDGLIHNSKLNGFNLQIGDRTEAKVINLDINKKRIGLEAVRKFYGWFCIPLVELDRNDSRLYFPRRATDMTKHAEKVLLSKVGGKK